MTEITSTTKNDPGDVRTVSRDKAARMALIHTSAHRGGCLYLGSVTILNQNTGASFTFTSTAAPGEISPEGAAAYIIRHADKCH